MTEQQLILFQTLKSFEKIGILKHVILIGSWAEYLYTYLYEGFVPNLRTTDVDFLYPNIRKPNEKVALTEVLESNGFISDTDGFGVTRYHHGNDLELEFLASERGSGQTEPYRIEPLGIMVEGLRLSLLIEESIEIEADGLIVIVPGPWAYVLHKLSINSIRGNKSAKDIEAIRILLDYFDGEEYFVGNLKRCYAGLTKKQRVAVDETCKANFVKLPVR